MTNKPPVKLTPPAKSRTPARKPRRALPFGLLWLLLGLAGVLLCVHFLISRQVPRNPAVQTSAESAKPVVTKPLELPKIDEKVLVETWDFPAQDIPDDLETALAQTPDLVCRSVDFDIEKRLLSPRFSLTRARAYLRPAQSGSYRFSYAGDPHARLYLQETGGARQEVIKCNAGSRLKNWDKKGQVSEPVQLQAGKIYLVDLVAGRRWPDPRPFELSWEGPNFSRRTVAGDAVQHFSAPAYQHQLRPDTVNAVCGRETAFSPLANDSLQGDAPVLLGITPSKLGSCRLAGGIVFFQAGPQAGSEELSCRFRCAGKEITSPLRLVVSPELAEGKIRSQLLEGVNKLADDFSRGRRILAAGPQTAALYDLKNGRGGGSSYESSSGFGNWGKGRIAAVPAWMLDGQGRLSEDAGRLFNNLFAWMNPGTAKIVCSPEAKAWGSNSDQWRSQIATADIIVVHERDLQSDDVEPLCQACLAGTGLLIGVERERPSLVSGLLAQAGILAYGWVDGSYEAGRRTPRFQGGALIQMLLTKQPVPEDQDVALMADGRWLDDALNGGWTTADAQLRLRDAELIAYNQARDLTPTLAKRLQDGKLTAYLIGRESDALQLPIPEASKPHRTALTPGSTLYVPPQTALIESQQVEIDTSMSGYIPTGCYAVAGKEIQVLVPPQLAGQGLILRIGDYSNGAEPRAARMGDQQRDFTIKSEVTRAVSPFGGLVYFYSDVNRISPKQRGAAPFRADIRGAIAAPLFILGKTSLEEWRNKIRHLPGPQAELWGPYFAATMPSSLIRDFDDPAESISHWGDWVKVYDRVNGCPERRNTPERVVLDVEPGAWAGYPFHGAHDWFKTYFACPGASRDLISSAGFPHELAHQAQSRPDHSWGYNPYTKNFEQTITIFDTCGARALAIRPQRSGWVSSRPYADESMRQMLRSAEGTSNPASHGGENLFPAFAEGELYVFLTHIFGEGIWAKFFADYARDEEQAPQHLPRSDAAKRDQWLIRFSRITGYDMREFFVDRLKLPVSAAALAETKALRLPVFRPALGGISEAATQPGLPVDIDLASPALSFDGVCKIGKVSVRKGGQVASGSAGHWTFTPDPGFSGLAEVEYETTSSSGFLYRNSLKIYVSGGGVNIALYPLGSGAKSPSDFDRVSPLHKGFCDELRTPWRLGGGHVVRLSGLLLPEASGSYEFGCTHSSTAKIWIVEESSALPANPSSTTHGWRGPDRYGTDTFKIDLQAGRKYRVEILMEQGAPGADSSKLFKNGWSEDFLSLYWTPPGKTGLYPIHAPHLLPMQQPMTLRTLPTQELK